MVEQVHIKSVKQHEEGGDNELVLKSGLEEGFGLRGRMCVWLREGRHGMEKTVAE